MRLCSPFTREPQWEQPCGWVPGESTGSGVPTLLEAVCVCRAPLPWQSEILTLEWTCSAVFLVGFSHWSGHEVQSSSRDSLTEVEGQCSSHHASLNSPMPSLHVTQNATIPCFFPSVWSVTDLLAPLPIEEKHAILDSLSALGFLIIAPW